jgi:predicted component of type VI protein secretion system
MPLFLELDQATGAAQRHPARTQCDAGSLVIGRSDDADIRLANPMVSRRHCVISGQGAAWQVTDQSTSGTLLNGERLVAPRPLADGDVLAIGEARIRIRIDGIGQIGTLNLDKWGKAGASQSDGALDAVLRAAGLSRAAVPLDDQALAGALGTILHDALATLVALAQERRCARRDLIAGDPAETNPLLAATDPGALLARLLAADGARALGQARRALEAHQRATLGAWQATFAATLDQFAPSAIRQRAANDAAAWHSYDRAFAARDGFTETFARELARIYSGLVDDGAAG